MAATAMHQTVRRWALTGGITAITITGTIYGASLKSDQEQNKERRRVLEATPKERITQLETARSELVRKKMELEIKLAQVAARRLAKQQAHKEVK